MSELPGIVAPAHGARAVVFDHGLATDLDTALHQAIVAIEDGVTGRQDAATLAQEHWSGTNRDEFDRTLEAQATSADGVAERYRSIRASIRTAWEDANALQASLNAAAEEAAEAEAEAAAAEEALPATS